MDSSRHLSGAQFLSIHTIGAMESEIPGMTVAEWHDSPERWGRFQQEMAQAKGFPSAEAHHDALTAHMREHGQGDPVRYFEDYRAGGLRNAQLGDGHHRYSAARDLEWKHMKAEPWTPQSKRTPVEGWDR